jgi:uncharacterized repeat protein (TIGR01451 family)
LQLDASADGPADVSARAAVVVAVNLAGQSEAALSLWVRGHDPQGGSIEISDDGGQSWATVASLPIVFTYQVVVVDLAEAAAGAGMSLTGDFLVRVATTANNAVPDDGYSVDQLCVQGFDPVLAAAKSGPAGVVAGDNLSYEVTISNNGALTATGVSLVDPIPAGTSYVAGSVTGGASYNSGQNRIEWNGTVGRFSSVTFTFAVTANGGPGSTIVNSATVGHASLGSPLEASATTRVVGTAAFGLCEGFEGGSLPSYMYAETTAAIDQSVGRVRVRADRPFHGSYSLQLDTASQFNNLATRQAAVMVVNMSGVSSAELSFWVWEHLEENHPEDGVFLSDDDGATYEQIYSFNNLPNRYQLVVLDLVEAANAAGVSLTADLRIKFQSRDDDPLPLDGYSLDEICVQSPKVHLTGTKSASVVALSGSPVEYTLSATNEGLVTANGATIEDAIPAGASYVGGSATGGASYNAAANQVEWSGNLGPGQTVTVTFAVNAELAAGFLDNVAAFDHSDMAYPYLAEAQTQVSSACGAMDVVFVIDTTQSMGEAIENVKGDVGSILSLIDDFSEGNYQLGLVTFDDEVTVVNDLAAGNTASVEANILALTASGGGNTPEASDEALNTVVNNLAARPGQSGSFSGPWRANAVKVVILITDAPPGGFDDTFTEGVDDVNAHNRALEAAADDILISAIYVPTVYQNDVAEVMMDYAATSNGIYRETTSEGEGTAAAISGIVGSCGVPTVDLEVEKADVADPWLANRNLTYVITVTNNGPAPATGVVLTDTMPAGTFPVSASTGCDDTTFVCVVGDLGVNETEVYSVTIHILGTTLGVITNTVEVTANEAELDTTNNMDTEATTITNQPTSIGLSEAQVDRGSTAGRIRLSLLAFLILMVATAGLAAVKASRRARRSPTG